MSKSSNSPEPIYELKHRLVGAVALVGIAVIIIPLLLSEPSVEANTSSESTIDVNGKNFRSRIVPLNLNNANGNEQVSTEATALGQAATTSSNQPRPALLQPANDENSTNNTSNGGNIPTTIVMTQQPDKKKTPSAASVAATAKSSETAPKNSATETSNTNNIELPEEQNQAGWVVRVGTFSKQANVDSVSTLLTNSGFKPRQSSIETSLGDSTRVWLGPFAKKDTAEKISDRLKKLIGEKGYVTRTNS